MTVLMKPREDGYCDRPSIVVRLYFISIRDSCNNFE